MSTVDYILDLLFWLIIKGVTKLTSSLDCMSHHLIEYFHWRHNCRSIVVSYWSRLDAVLVRKYLEVFGVFFDFWKSLRQTLLIHHYKYIWIIILIITQLTSLLWILRLGIHRQARICLFSHMFQCEFILVWIVSRFLSHFQSWCLRQAMLSCIISLKVTLRLQNCSILILFLLESKLFWYLKLLIFHKNPANW